MYGELIEKAKNAHSAEELLFLAEEENITLTKEQAEDYFARLNPTMGELADDELDSVSGGGCGGEPDYVLPTYQMGDTVAVKSAYRCDACGCEFGKIVRVSKGSYNSTKCRYYYTLICTSCGNQFAVEETKYSNQEYFCNKSDIIGRLG